MTQELRPITRGALELGKRLQEQARFAAQSGQPVEIFQDYLYNFVSQRRKPQASPQDPADFLAGAIRKDTRKGLRKVLHAKRLSTGVMTDDYRSETDSTGRQPPA